MFGNRPSKKLEKKLNRLADEAKEAKEAGDHEAERAMFGRMAKVANRIVAELGDGGGVESLEVGDDSAARLRDRGGTMFTSKEAKKLAKRAEKKAARVAKKAMRKSERERLGLTKTEDKARRALLKLAAQRSDKIEAEAEQQLTERLAAMYPPGQVKPAELAKAIRTAFAEARVVADPSRLGVRG